LNQYWEEHKITAQVLVWGESLGGGCAVLSAATRTSTHIIASHSNDPLPRMSSDHRQAAEYHEDKEWAASLLLLV
jgi:enterochelin esterase-like enzyme